MDKITKIKVKALKRRLRAEAICRKCELFFTNQVIDNRCIEEHPINVFVRWDLLINEIDKVFDKK